MSDLCDFDHPHPDHPCGRKTVHPARVIIEQTPSGLWAFELLGRDGSSIDHSMSSSRRLLWRMVRHSWRAAEGRANKVHIGGPIDA